jgi:hypothetical protein
MKGLPVYIKGEYAQRERQRDGVGQDQPHELDSHFGMHIVIGQHDNRLEIAPILGQEAPITVPAHAVWIAS